MMTCARRAVVATCLLAASLFVGLGTASSPAVGSDGPAGCVPDARLVNPCRPLLGAFSSTYPGVGGWHQQMDAEEQRIGRPLDVVHIYHPPGSAPPLTADEKYFATRPGTILFSNWKPAEQWADAAGGNDAVNAQIDQVADSIASVAPARIMLTLHHEPENDVTPGTSTCPGLKGTYGSPTDYRAMWRNVEDRFAARGVTNVVWVMDYMSYQAWDCLVPEMWPGNDLVDWVMFNPYSTGTSPTWSANVTRFYNLLTSKSDAAHDYLSKPWGLAEFGIGASTSQAQAYSYYDDARAGLAANTFPRLKAYIAFDADGVTKTRTSYSVAGVLDPVEQQHFNAFVSSPVFQQGDSVPPLVTLSTPTGGGHVRGDVPVSAVAVDSSGVYDVTYALDGGPAVDMDLDPSGAATATWDSTSVADGPHDLVVTARDSAGNASTSMATVTVENQDTSPPSTPGDLRTRSVSTDSVDLTWDPATDDRGVTGYRLTRDGAELSTGSATHFVDATVTPGSDYVYAVTAYDAAGNTSADAATLRVHVPEAADTEPPSTPELSVRLDGDDVALSWTAAEDNNAVQGYQVLRDGTPVARVNGATTGYVDRGLPQASSYAYTVQAFDAAGNTGDPTAPSTITLPDTTPPDAPTQVTAMEPPLLGGVAVSWAAATDNVAVAGYDVFRDGVFLASVTSRDYLDSTVAPGASYDYTVAAYDAAGNVGTESSPAHLTTRDTVPPTAPTRPTASLVGSVVNLSWPATSDNVGVTGYRVRRDGVDIATVTTTSYRDSSAPQGATHSYALVAYDAAGNSSTASPTTSVAVPDTTAPATPAQPTAALASGKVTVSWKAVSDNVGVVKYAVKRDGVVLASPTGTSYVDSTVKQGKTYSYTVTAYDAAGNVSASSPATSVLVPDTTAPATPAQPTAALASGKVTVSWKAVTDNVGVVKYAVSRDGVVLASPTGTSYVDSAPRQGRTSSYTVTAYDAAGNPSTASPAVSIAVPDTTAPSMPAGFKAVAGTRKAVLTWSPSADNVAVTGYEVWRGTTRIATTTSTTYTVTGLSTGASYSFKVRAYDAKGNLSPYTAQLTVKVL